MVNGDQLLVTLIRAYATARGISVSYASKVLTGSGDTVDRIEGGMSITARRAENIIQTASDQWPPSAAWPSDIPRPEPSASAGDPKDAA